MPIKEKIKVVKSRPGIKDKLIHYTEELEDGTIQVKTPRREYTLSVGDITANQAIEKVKEEYPTFTEFEYKTITYKKTGKKGEFIKRIDPPEKIEQRWQKKKDHIRELSDNVSRLKNRITRDLKSENEKDRLSALAISIMLKTGERVGNDQSAEYKKKSKNDKRKKAYGVTGFKVDHATIIGNKVHLDYIGKKGVPQEKSFSDEKIAKALKQAIRNCKGGFIFETSDHNITSNHVNDYLREFNISAKAIRGYSANKWVTDKLKSITPEDSDKKRKKQLARILKSVAEKVGHGPSVLKGQYLMPEVITYWVEKGEVFDIKEAGYVMKAGGKINSEQQSSEKKIEKRTLGGFAKSINNKDVETTTDSNGRKRFKIDDLSSKMNEQFVYEIIQIVEKSGELFITNLSNILYHWNGYKYYPDIKNIQIEFSHKKEYDFLAGYLPKRNKIIINVFKLINDYGKYIRNPRTSETISGDSGTGSRTGQTIIRSKRTYLLQLVRRKLFHEIQHVIQAREGIDLPPTQKKDVLAYAKAKYRKESLNDSEFEKWLSEKHSKPFASALYLEYRTIPSEKECFDVEEAFKKHDENTDDFSTLESGGSIKTLSNSNFKKWFSDSKAVDGKKKPMKLYHGTDADPFTVFDRNKTSANVSKFGFFFTDDKEFAKMFGEKVMEVYVSIQNPLVISQDEWNEIRLGHAKDEGYFAGWRKRLIDQGYDGLYAEESFEEFAGRKMRNPKIFVAFHPDQIKLSDNKTFDPNNPDIRYENGGDLSNNDDFANSKKTSNFTINTTKDELQNVLSGKSKVRNGDAIQTALNYLRRNEGSSTSGPRTKSDKSDLEKEKLIDFITENNFWYTGKLNDNNYLGRGTEQLVYKDPDFAGFVVKTNNSIFYDSWSEYLTNLLLHNYFFPDTSYELLGFKRSDRGTILPVVRQHFVPEGPPTNLEDVEKFLLEKGFIRTFRLMNIYENKDLGIIIGDLHAGNVLTKDDNLYFIDTKFFISPNADYVFNDDGTFNVNNPDIRFEHGGDFPNNEHFANSEKNRIFIPSKITKDELQSIISGTGKVANGDTIQAALFYIRGEEGANSINRGTKPDLETERLKNIISKNNLTKNGNQIITGTRSETSGATIQAASSNLRGSEGASHSNRSSNFKRQDGGSIREGVNLTNSDDFAESKKIRNFVVNPTKDEIQNVISGKGGTGHESQIRAAASYLRGSEKPGSVAKGSKQYKEQEAQRLRHYISENNLWISNPDPSSFLDEGCEQKTYLLDRENVVKVNDSIFFSTWEDYFNNLLLHNYFFPDTPYELLGFTENESKLFAIVKQPYIKANQKTDLDQVKQFMADNGFVNTKEENYENKELGLILEDLHSENVLTKDGILYFIDTVFYVKGNEAYAIGGKISSDLDGLAFKKMSDNLFLVTSDTQEKLAKLFVRPNSYLDCREFKGKIFTLSEFSDWYIKEKGAFTYYHDYKGFNIPDSVIDMFLNGSFDPLSEEEKWLMDNLRSVAPKKPYYVIGYVHVHGEEETRHHELAHALYYLSDTYRNEVNDVIEKFWKEISPKTLSAIQGFLKNLQYDKSIWNDEMNAYLIADKDYLIEKKAWSDEFDKYRKTLGKIFEINYFKTFGKEFENGLDERHAAGGLIQKGQDAVTRYYDKLVDAIVTIKEELADTGPSKESMLKDLLFQAQDKLQALVMHVPSLMHHVQSMNLLHFEDGGAVSEKIESGGIFNIYSTEKLNILYLHGLDATPKSDHVNILEKSQITIIAPKLQYGKESLFDHLSNIIKTKSINGIVGHSMGGRLAFYLSNKNKIPCLMFNPDFGAKDSKLQPVNESVETITPYYNQMAVVGLEDEEISAYDTIEFLKNTKCKIFTEKINHDIPDDIKIKYFNKFIGTVFPELAKRQIDEYVKEGIFITEEDRPAVGILPISRFNGPDADIFPNQLSVDSKGVSKWRKRIQAGERPYVLIDHVDYLGENRVKDAHHRLKAYEDLGSNAIPVIDVNGRILNAKRMASGGIMDESYKEWKSKNVTYCTIMDPLIGNETQQRSNKVYGSLGKGLYTTSLSNKSMAKEYGTLYFVVNGRPKNPKKFNNLDEWEIWFYDNLISRYSKAKGKDNPDKMDFMASTTIQDEMYKLGYDGIEIIGREVVNFTPGNDVRYFRTEDELRNYYDRMPKMEEGATIQHKSEGLDEIKTIIQELIKEEQTKGQDYPRSVAYQNHLNDLLSANDRKAVLTATYETDDYLKRADKYALEQNPRADKVRDFLSEFLHRKRKQFSKQYDTTSIRAWIENFKNERIKTFNLRKDFTNRPSTATERELRDIFQKIDNVIESLESPQSIGLYEESEFHTMRAEITSKLNHLKRVVKRSSFDYLVDTDIPKFEELVKGSLQQKIMNVEDRSSKR